MYAASSSLLAVILSVIIALSGAGAVSPIPETATQTTIRDITVTLNDETYHIEAQPYFTQAIGTELAAGTFGVHLGNEALLPMQAAVDPNGIRLSVGDSGKVYTLTNETIAESMGADSDDLKDVEAMISSITELASYDTAESLQMSRATYAVLKQVLPAGESTGSVQLSGEVVDLETYSGTLDGQTLAAMLDALMNGENQPLANYMKQLLAVGNRVSNTEYASWSEALEAEGMDEDLSYITLTYETAESGDDTYDCITLHTDGDDEAQAIEAALEYTLESGDYHCSIEMLTGDDEDQFSLSGTVDIENALTDAPSTEFDFTYGINSSWRYTDTDSPEDSHGYSNNMEMTLFGDARIENGLGSLNADLTVETSMERLSGADLETIDYSYSSYSGFNLAANETVAENEGIDTTVTLSMDLDGGTLDLYFIANQVDILFDADALFAGGEEVILTDDENDTGSAQMEADFMALANDASTLMTQDTGLADLISALTGSMYSDDSDDDYDDSDWGEGYEYLTVDEIMARFAGTKYTIDTPEGYEVDEDSTYITTDNSNAAIGYQSADGSDYITLYLYYSPDDTSKYAVLNDDGTSALIDNTVVTLKGWEDGTYYGAELHKDDVDITLYFNSMTLEEVQSLLSTLHAAE